jgi:hypothetical protein
LQAKALGVLNSLQEVREVVKSSFEVEIYNPVSKMNWESAFEKFKRLV